MADAFDVVTAGSTELLEGLPEPSPEWSSLALAADNVFLTPEWLLTWWRHFGGDRPAYTLLGRGSDGALAFLVLLYAERERPFRVLRFVGTGPSDELGPVCAPERRLEAMEALHATLSEHRAGAVLAADQLHGAAPWASLDGAATIARIAWPVVRVGPGGWEEVLARLPRKLRAEMRRRTRKFPGEGFAVRQVTAAAEFDEAFDWLLAAHRRRLASASNLLRPGMPEFHREFARTALDRGWLRFFLLERDGEIAAAWYGFRFGSADYYYQQARSETCPPGAGKYLSALAVESTCDDGLREHRFLRGGEAYKYEWTNRDDGVVTLAWGLTPAGGMLARAAGGALDGAPPVRRAVGRVVRHLLLS